LKSESFGKLSEQKIEHLKKHVHERSLYFQTPSVHCNFFFLQSNPETFSELEAKEMA